MFTSNMVLTLALAGIAFSVTALQANFSPNANEIVVVKFFKPGCQPCDNFAPSYKEVTRNFASKNTVSFFEVNAVANKGIAKAHSVMTVPTVLVFKNGKVVWRGNGRTLTANALSHAIHTALAA